MRRFVKVGEVEQLARRVDKLEWMLEPLSKKVDRLSTEVDELKDAEPPQQWEVVLKTRGMSEEVLTTLEGYPNGGPYRDGDQYIVGNLVYSFTLGDTIFLREKS